MKEYIKMTLATLTGLILFGFVSILLTTGIIGAIAALGDSKPVMPAQAVLTIDFSKMALAEQDQEADPLTALQGGDMIMPVGIYNAITAVNAAAEDPAVKFIYMKPDAAVGGLAQIEEFRTALKNFRESGKAIVSYIENPTNAGYYLASVSDKIYMTDHDGGMNMFNGISSQLIFLKDALDRLGVNVQLIRHGKYKSAGEMFVRNSSSKDNMEQNEAMINSVWERWANDIAESRGISTEELDAMLNNLELNFPSDFLAKGLADELLTRNELQKKLATLYMTDSYKDIKSISLADYSKLRNTTDITVTDNGRFKRHQSFVRTDGFVLFKHEHVQMELPFHVDLSVCHRYTRDDCAFVVQQYVAYVIGVKFVLALHVSAYAKTFKYARFGLFHHQIFPVHEVFHLLAAVRHNGRVHHDGDVYAGPLSTPSDVFRAERDLRKTRRR